MDIQQTLSDLYPYPAPRRPIKALLDFFEGTSSEEKATLDIDRFQLVGISKCEQGQCRCICGRPIVHVFQVSHLDYAISFGLGRECVKRFFPELKLRDMLSHQRWLEKLTMETQHAMATGLVAEAQIFKDAALHQLLTADQSRRLSQGIPLTLYERDTIEVQLEARLSVLKRHKQAIARKALAMSGHKSTPEAFKFLLAKLESGGEIKTLEALKQIDIAELAHNLLPDRGELTQGGNERGLDKDAFDAALDQARGLSQAQIERGKVLHSVVAFLATQREKLTLVAQQRLEDIEASIRAITEGSSEQDTAEQLCFRLLLRREIQQELVNMGNQLGINLSMDT